MRKLNSTDGFVMHAWMVTELGLKGPALVTYAIVYQFSQSNAGVYTGGVPYIASWLGCARESAKKYLHELADAGLIQAIQGNAYGVPYINYKALPLPIGKSKETSEGGIPQNLEGIPQNLGDTPQNLGIENNINNKYISSIPPTPQEIADYCRSRGWSDPEGFAAHFVDYYGTGEHPWHLSNGKPMRDWRKAVITWEPNNKFRSFTPAAPSQPTAQQPRAPKKSDYMQRMYAQAKRLGIIKEEESNGNDNDYDNR